ncbi:MAG: metallophosphoesterase [Candidatus Sumerlaeaceae bacterium]|nr:metallophosphoesterase [Candidatus Sumerlaeaceae bacterium]
MSSDMKRRDLLKMAGGLAAGTVAGGLLGSKAIAATNSASTDGKAKKRVYRIAHITDVHVKPEARSPEGMVAALQHIRNQPDQPDVIFNGGDLIMDALAATRERTKIQWDLAKKILADETKLPIENCIGNHDIWAWGGGKTDGTEADFLYGKEWALDELMMEKPYRSFDRAGWHFIVLDTVQTRPGGGGYSAHLDDEQFEWLKADLEKTPATTPVFVFSHIPIINVGSYFFGKNTEKDGQWKVISVLMLLDARRLKDLFYQHKNVKLCVSGHIHLLDQIIYNDVNYICSGAVSGNWWGGPFQETPEGYGLINLYDDGSHDYEYVIYGWKAKG